MRSLLDSQRTVLPCSIERTGRYDDRADITGRHHAYLPFFAAEPATLALSALSLVACFPRMVFCILFEIIPESSLFREVFCRQCLLHPSFTSFPSIRLLKQIDTMQICYDCLLPFVKCPEVPSRAQLFRYRPRGTEFLIHDSKHRSRGSLRNGLTRRTIFSCDNFFQIENLLGP